MRISMRNGQQYFLHINNYVARTESIISHFYSCSLDLNFLLEVSEEYTLAVSVSNYLQG